MDTFLQIVGGIVVAVVAVFAAGLAMVVFFTLNAVRLKAQDARLASAVARPWRIRLVPSAPDFRDRDRYAADRASLEAAGYRELGGFRVREMSRLRLAVLHHPARGAIAVLTEHEERGVHCDLVLPLPDDRDLTVSSGPPDAELAFLPDRIHHALPGAGIPELLARFDEESRGRVPRPVEPDGVAAELERRYAREMSARSGRGGPTDAEIRRAAGAVGAKLAADDLEAVRELASDQATAQIEEACLEQFLAETSLSPMTWEKIREDVLVVHARMTPREVRNAFLDPLESSDEVDVEALEVEAKALEAAISDPRALFASLNARLTGFRYEKLGEVGAPIRADIYRRP